jgi:hypothetical protein
MFVVSQSLHEHLKNYKNINNLHTAGLSWNGSLVSKICLCPNFLYDDRIVCSCFIIWMCIGLLGSGLGVQRWTWTAIEKMSKMEWNIKMMCTSRFKFQKCSPHGLWFLSLWGQGVSSHSTSSRTNEDTVHKFRIDWYLLSNPSS